MSTNKTENLQLHAWEPTDAFSRAEFNENFEKIDAAVGARAEKSVVTALQTVVSGKAQVVVGSYTGDGTSGNGKPTSITFDFTPRLVLLFGNRTDTYFGSMNGGDNSVAVLLWGVTDIINFRLGNNGGNNYVTYEGNTLKWYVPGTSSPTLAQYQMNTSGTVYRYVAIG